MAYQVALWQRFPKFRNRHGVHGSAVACLRIVWESHTACTGLLRDVPDVTLGTVAL